MIKIKLNEILSAIQGRTSKKENISIDKVFVDSRTIKGKNSLFFALKGNNFDGHSFVLDALKNGAKMAVVEFKPENIANSKKLIFVKNTLQALIDFSYFYKNLFEMPVLGITGSVGKTITKEYTANVLSEKYNVHKTKGNLNSIIGLPLTIFEMEDSHEISVLELATDHFGEIKKLTQICEPEIAIITNIGDSHLEFLNNIEGVFKEKYDIFKFSKKDSLKIFNGNIKFLQKYKNKKYFISYGENGDNGFVISSISQDDGKYRFSVNDEEYFINSDVKHNVFNSIPAIIIGKHFGLKSEEIQKGLLKKLELDLRMQILKNKSKNWTIIADCYNANPQSMLSALDYLKSVKNNNYQHKYAILGDMLELGEKKIKFHKEIGKCLKRLNIDKIISIGELSRFYESDFHYKSANDFLKNEKNISFPKSSLILVKASRKLKLEKIVERLVS